MTYKEKLLDPRWQRMRLEVMQRDDFKCQICNSTDKTLHVHHKYYLPVENPWEYPLTALVTLCHECHGQEEEFTIFKDWFVRTWLDNGLFNVDFEGFLRAKVALSRYDVKSLFIYLSDTEFCEELTALIRKHIRKPIPDDGMSF